MSARVLASHSMSRAVFRALFVCSWAIILLACGPSKNNPRHPETGLFSSAQYLPAGSPIWSPDGRYVAMGFEDRSTVEETNRALAALPREIHDPVFPEFNIAGGIPRIPVSIALWQGPKFPAGGATVLTRDGTDLPMAWNSGGTTLAFGAIRQSESGDKNWVIYASSAQTFADVREIASFPSLMKFAWAPGSDVLAMHACEKTCGIWTIDLGQETKPRLHFDATNGAEDFVWSSDGSALLVATSDRQDSSEIIRVPIDQSGDELLLQVNGRVGMIEAGGSGVLSVNVCTEVCELQIRVGGEMVKRIVNARMIGTWSPDGRYQLILQDRTGDGGKLTSLYGVIEYVASGVGAGSIRVTNLTEPLADVAWIAPAWVGGKNHEAIISVLQSSDEGGDWKVETIDVATLERSTIEMEGN